MVNRIHWKYEEKEQLVKHSARLMFAGQVESPVHGMRAAQAVLSADRRRDPHLLIESKNEWFRPWFDEELRKLQAEVVAKAKETSDAKKAAAVAVEQAPPPQPTPSLMVQPAAPEKPRLNDAAVNGATHDGMSGAAATTEVATPPATKFEHHFQSLRSLLVDELAAVMVEAALKAMGSAQLGGEPYVRVAEPEKPDADAQPRIVFQRPNTVHKSAVLVVGLKGSQKTEIQRDYGASLDLRFVSSDESKHQLRSMTEKAETTIVMTDFVNHSHEDIVKARCKKYIRQPGGLTQLRDTLAGLTH